jgi:diguanylate cyclase (GGDEF)-like protein
MPVASRVFSAKRWGFHLIVVGARALHIVATGKAQRGLWMGMMASTGEEHPVDRHCERTQRFWFESLDASGCPAWLRDCLMALIEATPAIVTVSSSQGRLLFINGVGRDMLGIDAHAEIRSRSVFDLYSPRSFDLLLAEAIPTCLRSGIWRGEMTLVDAGGKDIPVSQVLMVHHVQEHGGKETTTLSSIAWDIREMKDVERRLRHLATHDALTGLPNRLLLMDRLEYAIGCAARKGAHVGLLFLDLDGFKDVNDTYGHEAANQLLSGLGHRISRRLRAEDTIARYGGDEFVLVLPELATPESMGRIVGQVSAAVNEPFTVGNATVRLGASVGVAVFPIDGLDAGGLLRRADSRMYEQKMLSKSASRPAGGQSGNDSRLVRTRDPQVAA